MALTLGQISKYSRNNHSTSMGIRHIVESPTKQIQLHAARTQFSIITQNVGLLPPPLSAHTPDRNAAITELLKNLRILSPSVVCLSEVWVEREKERIRSELKDIYPHSLQGPDEPDLFEQDGGLLFLSKYPINKPDYAIYRTSEGPDSLANKGVLYGQVHPTGSVVPWNVFCTHTQDDAPYPSFPPGLNDKPLSDLYKQITTLGNFIQVKTAAEAFVNPTIVAGDFNINGLVIERYNQMLLRLGKPTVIDTWLAHRPRDKGLTTDGSRIDYILLRSGVSFIPVVERIEIIKWSYGGQPISDHYGLYAKFDEGLSIIK